MKIKVHTLAGLAVHSLNEFECRLDFARLLFPLAAAGPDCR